MNSIENKNIEEYLCNVIKQVKFNQAHKEIKYEFLSHLEESIRLGMSYGLTKNEAIDDAIKRMGNPIENGNQLNKIHTPKFDFVIAFSTMILCIIGLYTLNTLSFAQSQGLWMSIGLHHRIRPIFVKSKPSYKSITLYLRDHNNTISTLTFFRY